MRLNNIKEGTSASINTFKTNIEVETLKNEDYRRVLFTSKNLQLVLMSLKPGVEIGEERHTLDQFIRVESGVGTSVLDGKKNKVRDGDALVIPAGVKHNIINEGKEDLKLYTVYGPPNHKKGTVHKDKEDEQEEHFDGKTDL